jgi:hypothetical protein
MYHVIIDPDCLKTDAEVVNDEIINQFIKLLTDIREMENYYFLKPLVPPKAFDFSYNEPLNIFTLPSYVSGNEYTGRDFNVLLNYLTNVDDVYNLNREEGYYFNSFSVKSMDENGDKGSFLSEDLALDLILKNLFRGNTFLRSKLSKLIECSSEIKHIEKKEVYHFNDVLKLFATTNQILREVDITDLWKQAKTRNEYEEIMNVYFFLNNKSENMRKWEIGHSFFDNLKRYSFHTESTKINALLKAMLLIVKTDEPNRKTHKLRTSKSGGAPQVESQYGKGMRMDIDQEFHLHYWENQNKIIFASINTHNNFLIPV